MAPRYRALPALTADPSLVSTTLIMAYNCLEFQFPGIQHLLLAPMGPTHIWCMWTHAGSHNTFFFNLYYPWTKEREYSGATPGCKSHSLLKCNLTTTLLVQAHRRKKTHTHTRIFSAAFICSSKKLAVFKTFNKKTMVQCILLCSYSGLL